MIAGNARTKEFGTKWNMSARDDKKPPLSPFTERLFRAQSNFFETFPIFVSAVPTVFSKYHKGPLLTKLLVLHPELQLQVIFSDEVSDVVNEKIDTGIRVGFMRDSQLIAKIVSQLRFLIVATPELIQRTGMPQSLEDLSAIPVAAAIDPKTGRLWPWFLANGDP